MTQAGDMDKFLSEQREAPESPQSPNMRGKSAEITSMLFKPNYVNLSLFLMTMGFAQFTGSFAANYTNQAAPLLIAKNGWTTKEEQSKNTQLIGASIYAGTVLGAAFAGKIIQFGRRLSLFLVCFIGIIGCSLTIISAEKVSLLCLGRFILGYGYGLGSIAINRYIEEYVPLSIYGQCSAINLFIGQLGSFAALTSSAIYAKAPYDEDTAKMEQEQDQLYIANTNWRLVFGLPILTYSLCMVGLLTIIRHDTPKFYITKGDENSAKYAIHRIYKTGDSDIIAKKIVRFIKKSGDTTTTKATLIDSLFKDEKYIRASWTNIILMIAHVLTGYTAVKAFSTLIFKEILADPNTITPEQGTYIVGATSAVSAMIGIPVVKNFGRRTLLLYGHAVVALLHFVIAYCAYANYQILIIILVNVFLLVYLTTSGPVAWIYSAETCTDATLGVVIMTLWGFITIEVLTSKSIEEALSHVGFFAMFGIFNVLATVFVYFSVGETKGLSETEKKEIYLPGAKYGRALKPGEKAEGVGNEHKSRRTLKSEAIIMKFDSNEFTNRASVNPIYDDE